MIVGLVDLPDSLTGDYMANETNQQMLLYVATIVSTLNETYDGTPESNLYLFLNMDMDLWQRVKLVLLKTKMITIKGNYIRLTEAGKATAQKIDGMLKNKQATK